MDDEQNNEKYSVKNLLFYRAIPPYVVSEPTNGHKLYGCIDCGDRFMLQSSYNDHIGRKSMKITYTCRRCISSPQRKVFYNRCNLLAHIRSHSFKTATINVSDLKIEPLPLSFFKFNDVSVVTSKEQDQTTATKRSAKITPCRTICVECKEDITLDGDPNKDRVSHYMKYTNRFHSCPVCLLTLSTICALKSHLRVHLRNPPYYCPECGNQLPHKVVNYPFSHDCECFNMMRATVRLECPVSKCQSNLLHPNDYNKHLKTEHMKKVYKCPYCVVACFSEMTIYKHLGTHQLQHSSPVVNVLVFYQCEMCPGRLVLQSHLESHVNTHTQTNIFPSESRVDTHAQTNVFPCWTCGSRFKNIPLLIDHHINNHITAKNTMMEDLKYALSSSINQNQKAVKKKMFRVVKRCDQCLRRFSYKCVYDDIKILPNACPYKCTPASKSLLIKSCTESISTNIKCPLCKKKIEENWESIKKHFAMDHKSHKCLDGKITLLKDDLKIRRKRNRKRNVTNTKTRRVRKRTRVDKQNSEKSALEDTARPHSDLVCAKCQLNCESKEELENHIKEHKDPYMAYQCMECGESFVVKPSFFTHLLVKHGISDVDDYIAKKQCFSNDVLIISEKEECDMPLEENQCKICRERFGDSDELEKHFRVHGMAFLIKNAQIKPGSA